MPRHLQFADLYQELQDILLCSYGLSASQRMGKWLDHPGCTNNWPSAMWDNLTALQPTEVKVVQLILFLRKMRLHSPFQGTHRSSYPFFRGKGPAGNKSDRCCSPTPWPAQVTTGASTIPVSVPRPRNARRSAHTRKSSRPGSAPAPLQPPALLNPAAPPPPPCS
jgi:hypothetical protein